MEITKQQEILYNELSDSHAKYIADMPHLECWIIDAMNKYAEFIVVQQCKRSLSDIKINNNHQTS